MFLIVGDECGSVIETEYECLRVFSVSTTLLPLNVEVAPRDLPLSWFNNSNSGSLTHCLCPPIIPLPSMDETWEQEWNSFRFWRQLIEKPFYFIIRINNLRWQHFFETLGLSRLCNNLSLFALFFLLLRGIGFFQILEELRGLDYYFLILRNFAKRLHFFDNILGSLQLLRNIIRFLGDSFKGEV